jgi:hypothetical protein
MEMEENRFASADAIVPKIKLLTGLFALLFAGRMMKGEVACLCLISSNHFLNGYVYLIGSMTTA